MRRYAITRFLSFSQSIGPFSQGGNRSDSKLLHPVRLARLGRVRPRTDGKQPFEKAPHRSRRGCRIAPPAGESVPQEAPLGDVGKARAGFVRHRKSTAWGLGGGDVCPVGDQFDSGIAAPASGVKGGAGDRRLEKSGSPFPGTTPGGSCVCPSRGCKPEGIGDLPVRAGLRPAPKSPALASKSLDPAACKRSEDESEGELDGEGVSSDLPWAMKLAGSFGMSLANSSTLSGRPRDGSMRSKEGSTCNSEDGDRVASALVESFGMEWGEPADVRRPWGTFALSFEKNKTATIAPRAMMEAPSNLGGCMEVSDMLQSRFGSWTSVRPPDGLSMGTIRIQSMPQEILEHEENGPNSEDTDRNG